MKELQLHVLGLVQFSMICLLCASRSMANTARDGQGNMTVSPTAVNAGTPNNYLFRLNTQKKYFNPGSQATLQIPSGWSAPQTSNATGPGYVIVTPVQSASTAVLAGISGSGPWTLTINFSTSQNQAGFTVNYNGAVAPTNGGIYTFAAQTRQSGGNLRTLRSGSPTITVDVLSKTNTTTSLSANLNPSTYGGSVTFSASVTDTGGAIPTGTVAFLEGDVVLGTVVLNGSANASFSTNRFVVLDSPCWITAEYSGDLTHNASVSAVWQQTVNPATLTLSGLAAQNKIYDGGTVAMLDLSNASLSGVLPGDNVALDPSAATGSFADPNAGSSKPVNVSGLALLGADSGNYVLGSMNGVTANILPAPLSVTANNTNRFFGSPNPPFTATYSGFVPGENVSVLRGTPSLSSTAVPTSPVAGNPYTIVAAQGTLAAANYSFVFSPGQLTIVAGPAQPQTIVSITKLADGTTSLYCGGAAGQTYLLQASADLTPGSWTTIGTNTTDVSGFMTYLDSLATNFPSRFYRTSLP